jgi:hypothetical protein
VCTSPPRVPLAPQAQYIRASPVGLQSSFLLRRLDQIRPAAVEGGMQGRESNEKPGKVLVARVTIRKPVPHILVSPAVAGRTDEAKDANKLNHSFSMHPLRPL